MNQLQVFVKPVRNRFALWIRSVFSNSPAGWRLKKGGDFPIKDFEYKTLKEAKAAAVALQEYLDGASAQEMMSNREAKLTSKLQQWNQMVEDSTDQGNQ